MRYKHVFAVCAYKDSPYLEQCIRSLKAQTVPSHIIICTSTPAPTLTGWLEIRPAGLRTAWGERNKGMTGILHIPWRRASWSPLRTRMTCTTVITARDFWQPIEISGYDCFYNGLCDCETGNAHHR